MLARTRTSAERYLIFACWFRYMLSAFHEYTYKEVASGLSFIALGSIFLITLGFLILDKRRLFTWAFFPVVIVCLLMAVSGFVNQYPKGVVEPIVRWIFFVIISVAFWQAIDTGGARAITRLLWVFAGPILFQIELIVLGVAKAGELDGSVSYIGGYYHEQPFSLILASCFFLACFATQIRRWVKVALSIASLVGIALANYRTTILGMGPLAAVQLFTGIPAAVRPAQRGFVRMALLILGVGGLMTVAAVDSQRFADLGAVASRGTSIIKPPDTFTRDDRLVLNGRLYIWSWYIAEYEKGTPAQKIVGFGPDSWSSVFPRYAHNTLVSYLYELGVLGVAAILLLWGVMVAIALRVRRGLRAKVLAAHASFFLLNMATMPHWQVEGNILYSLICGYTFAAARAARLAKIAERPRVSGAGYFTPVPQAGGLPAPAQ